MTCHTSSLLISSDPIQHLVQRNDLPHCIAINIAIDRTIPVHLLPPSAAASCPAAGAAAG